MSTKTPQTRLQARRTGTRASQSDEIDRKFVLINATATLTVILLVTFAYFRYHKSIIQVPRLVSVTDRLVYALQLQTFSLIPIFAAIGHILSIRVSTAARNPLSGHENLVEKPVRILTNTIEQTIINVFNVLILVTFLPVDYLFVIPFLTFCFVTGRIIFHIGYAIHPKFRTYGFMLTFLPTSIIFFTNLAYVTGLNKFISSHAPKIEL